MIKSLIGCRVSEWMGESAQFKSGNGCDVTKRAIIDVNSIVSGRNYDILALIIAQILTTIP